MKPTEGKKIMAIHWKKISGDEESVRARGNMELRYHTVYMGDRDDEWVLQLVDGVEVARHNVKYLSTIQWEAGKETSNG